MDENEKLKLAVKLVSAVISNPNTELVYTGHKHIGAKKEEDRQLILGNQLGIQLPTYGIENEKNMCEVGDLIKEIMQKIL